MSIVAKYLPLVLMVLVVIAVIICYVKFGRHTADNESTHPRQQTREQQPPAAAKAQRQRPAEVKKSVDEIKQNSYWSKDLMHVSEQDLMREAEPPAAKDNIYLDEVEEKADKPSPLEETLFLPNQGVWSDPLAAPAAAPLATASLNAAADEDDLGLTRVLSSNQTLVLPGVLRQKPQADDDLAAPDFVLAEKPMAFGYKMCWLAIEDAEPQRVINALDLLNVEESGWTQGLTAAYEDKGRVFVTPRMHGYTLVIGRALWHKMDLDLAIEDISWFAKISKQLGDVKYFSTSSELNNHAWAWARRGKLLRAYGYSGEIDAVIWNYGKPTREELDLGFRFMGFPNNKTQSRTIAGQDDVIALACDWSIDTTFSDGDYLPSTGFVGTIKR